MTGIIPLGDFTRVATDATMAYEINRPSRSQSAVDARVQTVAADIIASDGTVKAAAKAAVGTAVDDAGLLKRAEIGAVRTLSSDDPQYSEVRLSRDFRRTGGTLKTGGEVGVLPGSVESALPSGSGEVLLTRDYRRAQPASAGGGVTPTPIVEEWLSRFGRIAMWGDSMTTATYGGGDSQISLLAAELGVTPYDGGRSGHTGTEIAFRAGALAVRVTVPGGTIPAVGAVAATVEPALGWWNWKEIPAVLRSSSGTLVRVLLKHASPSPGTLPTWTIEQVGGTAPAPVLPATRIAPETPTSALGAPVVFWIGRNDPDETRVVDAMKALLNAHRDPGRRRLVLPIFNRQDSPAGSPSYVRDMAVNAKLAELTGTDYFAARRKIIDHGLQLAGIAPTAADVAAVSEDRIPPSLMADITHLNPAGRGALARILAIEITGRNW